MAIKKEEKEISKFDTIKEELEELLQNFPLRKFIIIVFSVGFLFLLIGIFLIFFKIETNCGDGTAYGKCSINKPYFCSNGTLIEKASVCGCNSNLTLTGDSCTSKYQEESKEITLEYVLRGEEKEINMTIYKKMADYLSNLPPLFLPRMEIISQEQIFNLELSTMRNRKISSCLLLLKSRILPEIRQNK